MSNPVAAAPDVVDDKASHQPHSSQPGRVIAISSGKGGVGKTSISVNLAIALADKGLRVCVFDADTSLANVNILLNLRPLYTLEHVINGSQPLDAVVLEGPHGIAIVPAASGIAEFAHLNAEQQKLLLDALATLEQQFDYLIVDTAAGISENVLSFLQASGHCLLVVTPEPTSLTDAFALMKVMKRRNCQSHIHVLTNMVDGYVDSMDLYKRLLGAAKRHLQMEISYLGYVPRDDYMRLSVQRQVPVMAAFPTSSSGFRFQSLASSIENIYRAAPPRQSFSRFWRGLLRTTTGEDPGPLAIPDSALLTVRQRPTFSQTTVTRLHQSMVQVVRSRTLSPNTMKSLLRSLLGAVGRHYPEIDLRDLQRRPPPAGDNPNSRDTASQTSRTPPL